MDVTDAAVNPYDLNDVARLRRIRRAIHQSMSFGCFKTYTQMDLYDLNDIGEIRLSLLLTNMRDRK